jgi:hypothetical protein
MHLGRPLRQWSAKDANGCVRATLANHQVGNEITCGPAFAQCGGVRADFEEKFGKGNALLAY